MTIIAIDDEGLALSALLETIRRAIPEAVLEGFRNPAASLDYVRGHSVDVAFLDIRMREMDGLELAKRLKEICGKINVIFTTGYSEYAVDAFSLFASGYLLKPVSCEAVRNALEHLRFPVREEEPRRIQVKTFGNFEAFMDGKPIHFARSKAKELFAYLVHKRGTGCTVKELSAVLFEDRAYGISMQKQMQTYISSMRQSLRDAGAGNVVVRRYNSLAVDVSKIDCDYYRFLRWDAAAVNEYTGEYMANYSWAEFVIGYLDSRVL